MGVASSTLKNLFRDPTDETIRNKPIGFIITPKITIHSRAITYFIFKIFRNKNAIIRYQ